MNRIPTPPEQNASPSPEIHAHKVRRWSDKEAQRKLAQLQRNLHEFREELLRAQASVLLSTAEEFKEVQGRAFEGNQAAIALVSTILDIAQSGVILSPKAWQVKREQN